MKRWISIAFVLCIVVFSACNRAVETRHGTSLPPSASPELQAIDSLMWQRPDSALMRLLPWFDTYCRDAACHVSTAYNDHYAHLLLAELLYKNDYAQTNREELRQAVAYFDSLTLTLSHNPKPRSRHSGLEPPSPNPNDDLFFLAARAHYINGVGYYERDSVVEACKEYLKALETMEGHFKEKELVRKKARFMALTYNRLGDLFSAHLMTELAIVSYKKALLYCKIEPTSPYGTPIILYNLGIQFDVAGHKDSAAFFYEDALQNLSDSNNLHYRDILNSKGVLAYNTGHNVDSILFGLKQIANQAADENERMTRYLAIGSILYEDRQLDSACFYLEKVFEKHTDIQARIPAAELLRSIYHIKEDSAKYNLYAAFLADFTFQEYESKNTVSKLNDLFHNYSGQKQQMQSVKTRTKAIKTALMAFACIAIVTALTVFFLTKRKGKSVLMKQEEEAEKQLSAANQQYEEAMKKLQAEINQRRTKVELVREEFLNEPVCQTIIGLVSDLPITARTHHSDYLHIRLDDTTGAELGLAVSRHYPDFKARMLAYAPQTRQKDLLICYLYLLGLNDFQIALLLECHNSTIFRRASNMQKALGTDIPLSDFVKELACS